MRTHSIALALSILGLIAACDSGTEQRSIRNAETGESITVRSGTGAAAPRNMPAYAPIYPGAVIESSMDGVSSSAEGGQSGGMVAFRTSDSPQKVASFYRARLDSSGLTERNDANLNGTMLLTAASSDDTDHGVQISISPSEQGNGSVVSVIYSRGRG